MSTDQPASTPHDSGHTSGRANLGHSPGPPFSVDLLVELAESLHDAGRADEARLERLASRVPSATRTVVLTGPEYADLRRSLLMVEVSRRLNMQSRSVGVSQAIAELRAELLTRLPGVEPDIEAVLGMAAMFADISASDGPEAPAPDSARSTAPGTSFPATAANPAADATASPVALAQGVTLGKYILREPIGEGAFGEVWRAWDTTLRRSVALKLIRVRSTVSSRLAQERFFAEARAAASLDHPNVVKVHDVGRFESVGRWFIDAQLVGEPAPTPADPLAVRVGCSLEEYAAARPAAPASGADFRLITRIMLDATRGVAAAHARGVLHRDLKPANILLTPSLRALVADFGLSTSGLTPHAAADHEHAETPANPDASIRQTVAFRGEHGRIVGTPAFMAPEQARGERCTPATDVYALGATLRFLITRRPPVSASGSFSPDARWDVIHQVQRLAERPLEPVARLAPRVPADLAAICDRATSADPAQRYASAEELASDLQAFLDRRPVLAARPGAARRALLFTRRNPAPVAIAALATVIIIAGTARALISLRQERDIARAATIRAIDERDRAVAAERLAAERLAEAQRARDASEVVTRFLVETLAAAQTVRGGPTITLADAIMQALPKIEKAFASQPESEAAVRYTLGGALVSLGRFAEARPQIERSLALRRELLGEDHPETVRSRVVEALADEAVQEDEAIIERLRELERVAARVLGETNSSTLALRDAMCRRLTELFRTDESEPMLRQTLATRVAINGPDHPESLACRQNLARALWLMRRHMEAEREYIATIEGWERTAGPDYLATWLVRQQLGGLYLDMRDRRAEKILVDSLARLERDLGAQHETVLTAAFNIAMMRLFAERDAKSCREIAEKYLPASVKTYGQSHSTTLRLRSLIAEARLLQGDIADLEPFARETYQTALEAQGRRGQDTVIAGSVLYGLFMATGEHDKARRYQRFARPDQPPPPEPKPDLAPAPGPGPAESPTP
ncbi:MAG: protein kinase domain-containing protein [Phycisphaerales bacterium]